MRIFEKRHGIILFFPKMLKIVLFFCAIFLELCPKLENPFEFIWNLKSSFEIRKCNLNLIISYPIWKLISIMDPEELCHVIRLNTLTWHHSVRSMFEINVQTFKFQSSIWDFKWIQMNFQEIKVLGISLAFYVIVRMASDEGENRKRIIKLSF